MRNPLRSEAEAYRFLGVVIVGAAVIIGAAFINTWLGVAVAVIAFAAIRNSNASCSLRSGFQVGRRGGVDREPP